MKKTLLVILDDLLVADIVVHVFRDWHSVRVTRLEELRPVAATIQPDLIISELNFSGNGTHLWPDFIFKFAQEHPQTVLIFWTDILCVEEGWRSLRANVILISRSDSIYNLPDLYEMAQSHQDKVSVPNAEGSWWAGLVASGAMLAALAFRISERTKEVLWDLESLLALTPLEFERVIKERFEAEGYQATLTKQSHDDGVDIIVTRDQPPEGLVVLLVQCKLYKERASVPSKDIRDLRGAVEFEKGTKGILVSTMPLSVPALKKLRTQAERLASITGTDLIAWLNSGLIAASKPGSP